MQQLRREKSLDSLVGQRAGIGDGHETEDEPAEQERTRDQATPARRKPAGANRAEHRLQLPPPDAAEAEPGCGCEHDGRDVIGMPQREAQHDRSPERMPDDGRRQHALPCGERRHPIRERLEARDGRQGLRPAVAGQVRNEQPVVRDEERGELRPVGRGPTQAVDEDQRRALAPHEIAHPGALELGESLLQGG